MNWYEKDRNELLAELQSNPETGLSSSAVLEKQQRYGKNQFEEQEQESILKKILHILQDVSIIVLLIAAILSLIMGIFNPDDDGKGMTAFIVIMGIVILNTILAITQEGKAEKALAALKNMNSPTSLVIRDGKQVEVDSVELVPGDILVLKTGDATSADARILECNDFAVDESALTGESVPAEKDANLELEGNVVVGDRLNMVFAGCLVTAGRAKALVTATGMETEMGNIAKFLNNAQKLKTPLQTRLDRIGKIISVIAISSALVLFGLNIMRGVGIWDTIMTAISLSVAAVPEMLALIVTLTLANGVSKMVKENALIRALPAVETLGSTSVICSDKTGTLTQNRMTIQRLWLEGKDVFEAESNFNKDQALFLERLTLASNAQAQVQPDGSIEVIGDPTESSIIRLLHLKGEEKGVLEAKYPRVAEISFSSLRKMMTTVHKDPKGGYLVLTKGAFDRVPFETVGQDELEMRQWIHDEFANDALRIIALGSKHVDELPPEDQLTELEKDLKFEGIIGIIDPPRPEAAEAIAKAKNAGVRTVMITGDHAATAGAIARQIGILSEGERIVTGAEMTEMSDEELIANVRQYSVYARVSPEDKIRIVEAWQEHNEVVAMTGDGVNDAPALKAADVGIAMGINGTEVAKSASDMILTDDNFATIVSAIHRGRDVFSNIRKTVYFLLTCNFSEIVIMVGAALMGWGMPLTPIMLLLINVVGDGIPGLRLAYETSDPRIMQRKPIGRDESIFEGLQFVMAKQVLSFVFVAWTAYYIGTGEMPFANDQTATAHMVGQTMTFLALGWCAVLHVFTVRSRISIFRRSILDNPRIAIYAFAMILLFAAFVLIPPVAGFLHMTSLNGFQWLTVMGLALIPTIVAELGKLVQLSFEKRNFRRRLVRHQIIDEQ